MMRLPEGFAGPRVACPSCRAPFDVPAVAAPAPSHVSVTPAPPTPAPPSPPPPPPEPMEYEARAPVRAPSPEYPGADEPPPVQEPYPGGPEPETPEVLDRKSLLRWAVVRTSLSLIVTGGAAALLAALLIVLLAMSRARSPHGSEWMVRVAALAGVIAGAGAVVYITGMALALVSPRGQVMAAGAVGLLAAAVVVILVQAFEGEGGGSALFGGRPDRDPGEPRSRGFVPILLSLLQTALLYGSQFFYAGFLARVARGFGRRTLAGTLLVYQATSGVLVAILWLLSLAEILARSPGPFLPYVSLAFTGLLWLAGGAFLVLALLVRHAVSKVLES